MVASARMVGCAKHLEEIILPDLPEMEISLPKVSTATLKTNFSFRTKQIVRIIKEQVDPKEAPGLELVGRE